MALSLVALSATSLAGDLTGAKLYAPARQRALVIGASGYDQLGRLEFAAEDARRVAAALTGKLGFEADAVRLLTDDAEVDALTPTAGRILNQLDDLLEDAGEGSTDLLLVYFSGHGIGTEDGDYLLPVDTSIRNVATFGVPVAKIVERLTVADARNVLLVVDACRQGAENEFGTKLWELAETANLAIVLGCEPGTQSYEDGVWGSGVFTHFLLEALDEQDLRDPLTGALWASRLAGAVRERVSTFTAREPVPQVPSIWTDPTRDVLLSAVLPEELESVVVHAFADGARTRLDPRSYVVATARFADELLVHGRAEEAIRLLQTAEQLGTLSDHSRYQLGTALLALGREAEGSRALATLSTSAPDTPFARMAAVVDTTGGTPAPARHEAAVGLWESRWPVAPDVLVLMLDAHLRGGPIGEALGFARQLATNLAPGSRGATYSAGVASQLSGDTSRALELFEAAGQVEGGGFPSDAFLVNARIQLLEGLKQSTAALSLLDSAIQRWPDSGLWWAWRAWSRRQAGDREGSFADAAVAVSKDLSPPWLLLAVRSAGTRAPELAEAVLARAATTPLAWHARLAAIFCEAEPGADVTSQIQEMSRLAARPALAWSLAARMSHERSTEQLLELAHNKGVDSPEVARARAAVWQQTFALYDNLAPRGGELGTDYESWRFLYELAESLGRFWELSVLLDRHFGPALETGRLPSPLAVLYGLVSLNVGDLDRAETLRALLQPGSADHDAAVWMCAAFLACHGDAAQARATLGDREAPLHPRFLPMARPLRALIAARLGDDERARSELAAAGTPPTAFVQALHVLTLRVLGEHERADLWTRQLESTPATLGFFARAACWREAAARGEQARCALLAGTFQPANPLVEEFAYLDDPTLEALVGTHQLTLIDGHGPGFVQDARLFLTIVEDGTALGTLLAGDAPPRVFEGTVDRFGNLRAELPGKELVHAKLPPPGWKPEDPELVGATLTIHVLDARGVPGIWVTR